LVVAGVAFTAAGAAAVFVLAEVARELEAVLAFALAFAFAEALAEAFAVGVVAARAALVAPALLEAPDVAVGVAPAASGVGPPASGVVEVSTATELVAAIG